SEQVVIQHNVLADGNSSRIRNLTPQPDPQYDGSITIAINDSDYVTDNGEENYYNATHFQLSDINFGLSTNINFGSGTSVDVFDNEDLFNHPASSDYTPLCDLIDNPTIKNSIVSGWNSYVTMLGVVYYAGAIKPACL